MPVIIVVSFALIAAAAAVARWQLARLNRSDWPGGTLTVNIGAAFLVGLLHDTAGHTITLVGIAALGSYSTLSTVMLEVVDTAEAGSTNRAATYLLTTLVAGIGAASLGIQLG